MSKIAWVFWALTSMVVIVPMALAAATVGAIYGAVTWGAEAVVFLWEQHGPNRMARLSRAGRGRGK